MFSGLTWKFLNLDCISTHHSINSIAYRNAQLGKHFPALKEIQRYAGYGGPDGEWLRGGSYAAHMYNPETKQGKALQQIKTHLRAAVKGDTAKHCAHLLHYIVDVFSPPHQYGKPQKGAPENDWDDPYASPSFFKSFFLPHFQWEGRAGWWLLWNKQTLVLDIPNLRSVDACMQCVEHHIKEIHRKNIFLNYVNHKTFNEKDIKDLFERMASCSAALLTFINHEMEKHSP